MSILELKARHLALETMVEYFLEDIYDSEQLESIVMQELHEDLGITWDAAEELATRLVDELFLDADDIARQEMRETQDALDTIDDALRTCYARG